MNTNAVAASATDSCVLVSRQVTEQRQERTITRTEVTSHRSKGDASSFPTTNGHSKSVLSTTASDNNRHHQQQQHLHSSSNYSNITSGSATLPSLSKHLHHHHLNNLGVDSSTNSQLISRTLKHHSSTQQETRITQIVREFQQMGPEGQQMDYSGASRSNQVGVQGADYMQPGSGYGTNPRPHYPPANAVVDHNMVGYDPGLMQDPYYARAQLPPDAAGRNYAGYPTTSTVNNDGGSAGSYRDYEQYPEYPTNYNTSGGEHGGHTLRSASGHSGLVHSGTGAYAEYRHYPDRPGSPISPSERSESPSRMPNNSDYLRQADGYPPVVGYEELDSGIAPPPRPEYHPAQNTHPNYDGNRGGGGNGEYVTASAVPGGWSQSNTANNSNPSGHNMGNITGGSSGKNVSNNNGGLGVTSHYGNLPVRPYLLAGNSGISAGNHSTSSNLGSNDDNRDRLSSHPSPSMTGVPNHLASSSNMIDQRIQSPPGHSRRLLSAGGGSVSNDIGSQQLHHFQNMHLNHDDDNHLPGPSHMINNNNNGTGVRWRDPDLHEVIQFLGNPNPVVKANAAAYLQHLCYMDDPVKTKTRVLGGVPPLVSLLSHDQPEVHRNSCGALRNLSYGRQNDENKKAIKSAGGIPALVRLLKRSPDNEVKELVTGVLWNLSSCEELKKSIIDDGIIPLVHAVIIPHSGWDRNNISGNSTSHVPDACWSTVFKNASGVLRNVSSAGEYARKKLRECEGLVEALLHVVRCALSRADIDDKSVENCVCILRNLSYRCQEVEDPNYDKHPPPAQSRAAATSSGKGDNLGCFGANKKKKEASFNSSPKEGNAVNTGPTRSASQTNKSEPVRGMELLWQPEVVQAYLALLSNCSNPETLEAAAGAIQNLAACYWQASIEIRAAVRKEKGLPVLVELLRMEVDRVVCAVATALRNLALDQRNKELIGKYAMRDLVQKLPSGRPHDQGTSDDTIAAVLATLNEVIKKNAEFSRSLMEAEGVERLVLLTQQRRRFSPRVVKFASQVLYSMWQHQELREVYKKAGWTEQDFVSKGSSVRGNSPGPGGSGTEPSSAGSPVNANSTLNRPMASQGGTRYEDKTMHRGVNNSVPKSPPPSYPQPGEDVPMADMPYPPSGSHAPPPGAFRMYPSPPVQPGEPLYAQVNRDRKKNRIFEQNSRANYVAYNSSPSGETHTRWQENSNSVTHSVDNLSHQPAGDSWV